MDRYAIEAVGRANELLDLLTDEQADIVRGWLAINNDVSLWEGMVTLSPRTLKRLGQTPAQDRAWFQKTDRPTFLREWLAVRHWAIASARSLWIAARLQDAKGLPYRRAVQQGAQVASALLELPEAEDLLTLRLTDGQSRPVGPREARRAI